MLALWLRVALLNFLVAAIMGVVLRYAFVTELSWLKYRAFQHGHSHVAMLGWLYLGWYTLLIKAFLPSRRQIAGFYRNNFLLTQFSVLGMLVSFPIQGYGGWSIAFATLHGLASYAFVYRFTKDIGEDKSHAATFARTALSFMVLSTLSLWAMPLIIMSGQQGKAIYYQAVQFYLHFQFNGWFVFAALALFFRMIDNEGFFALVKLPRRFFILLASSCILTYALAVAWSNPSVIVFAANSLGVLTQLAALVVFMIFIRKIHRPLSIFLNDWGGWLIQLAFFTFCLKIIVQTAVVIPDIAKVAYTIRGFVIGFVHLILLGMLTPFILGYAGRCGIIATQTRAFKTGAILLLFGFFASEGLLAWQGIMLWAAKGFMPYYHEALLLASLPMPLGVALLLVGSFQR
jgi:hypothetical protein